MQASLVTAQVEFKLIDPESGLGLAGVPVRLVVGGAPGWQAPNAGHRFVTDSNGEARFTAEGLVDRRWRMAPYSMTGVKRPRRSDHILLAAELEQLVPTAGGEPNRHQWLHTLDIDCDSPTECSSSGITAVHSRDAQGAFTRLGQIAGAGLKVPELGGLVLNGPGYRVESFSLSPDPEQTGWRVKLTLLRNAPPLRH
jgi:hypothetical protein